FEQLRMDVRAEEQAITLYRRIIEWVNDEEDIITSKLFEDVLSHEESHHDTFSTLLVGLAEFSPP
ncbi:MAG: ferritin-like domain-containing protein, partial [Candidatus Bathyarchaeota archaeon]|nr:ferritin-like domain-containing protein [Candidatus Bathyarchaeota archaeon]